MKRERSPSDRGSPPKLAKLDHDDHLLDSPCLDHRFFPWDFVTPLMPRGSLIALRATCRRLRDLADSILFEHIVIRSSVNVLDFSDKKSAKPWLMLKTSDWVTVEGGSIGCPTLDGRQIGRFGPLLPLHTYAPWYTSRRETAKAKKGREKNGGAGNQHSNAKSPVKAPKGRDPLKLADEEEAFARRVRLARIVDIKGTVSYRTLAWFSSVMRTSDIQAVRLLASPSGAHSFVLPRFICDTLVIFSRDFHRMPHGTAPSAFQGLIPAGFKRIVQNITLPWTLEYASPTFRLPEAAADCRINATSLTADWESLPEVVLNFTNFLPLDSDFEEGNHGLGRWECMTQGSEKKAWGQLVTAMADALRFGSKCIVVGLHHIRSIWFSSDTDLAYNEYLSMVHRCRSGLQRVSLDGAPQGQLGSAHTLRRHRVEAGPAR